MAGRGAPTDIACSSLVQSRERTRATPGAGRRSAAAACRGRCSGSASGTASESGCEQVLYRLRTGGASCDARAPTCNAGRTLIAQVSSRWKRKRTGQSRDHIEAGMAQGGEERHGRSSRLRLSPHTPALPFGRRLSSTASGQVWQARLQKEARRLLARPCAATWRPLRVGVRRCDGVANDCCHLPLASIRPCPRSCRAVPRTQL